MKNFWLIVLIIFGFFVATLSGYLLSDFLNSLEISNTANWIKIDKNAPTGVSTSLIDASSLLGKSKATCEGCDYNPSITTDVQQNTDQSKTTAIGKVLVHYNYTPDYYILAQNQPSTATEIIHDLLRQQEIGHLSSNVNIPDISYLTTHSKTTNGVYVISANSVALARNANLTTNFSISIPTLSYEQFKALKNNKDYNLIYGLIRGIVGHEELHFRALNTYIEELAQILNHPINKDLNITAPSETEMQIKLNAILLETTKNRLATARSKHESAQNAIDDETLRQRISLQFKEKVNGEIPATIIGEFRGKVTFDFDLPAGEIPKPPVPDISTDKTTKN